MLETARALDRGGFDTIWLAEAYPWWRKHGMEARSSTAVSSLMARDTERLTIALGDHLGVHAPPGAGRDGRARRAGGRRARAASSPGSGRRRSSSTTRSRAARRRRRSRSRTCATRSRSCAARSRASASSTTGKVFSADLPALSPEARRARLGRAGLRGRDGAADAAARRRDRRRAADAVDHDAGVRRVHARERPHGRREGGRDPEEVDVGCTIVASIDATTATAAATARARSPACTSRTSSRTSAAPPTRCSSWPRSRWRSSRRSPRRWSAGGRLAAKEQVTRLAARPLQADRRHARRLHRRDRGVPRRGLHARDARALGRRPPRADPPLRRAGAAALPLMTIADRPRPAGRLGVAGDRDAELHRRRAGDGRADARHVRRDGPAGAVAAGRGRPRRTCSAPGRAPAAGRA